MILNGVKTTAIDSSAATLATGGVMAALAAGTLPVTAPMVAGAAIAAGVVVASMKAIGFIRASIFKSRVEDLERHAESLGLDPASIAVKCRTDQNGDDFAKDHPRLLSHLSQDKELVAWSVGSVGLPCDHYRLSRAAVEEAKIGMSASANRTFRPGASCRPLANAERQRVRG